MIALLHCRSTSGSLLAPSTDRHHLPSYMIIQDGCTAGLKWRGQHSFTAWRRLCALGSGWDRGGGHLVESFQRGHRSLWCHLLLLIGLLFTTQKCLLAKVFVCVCVCTLCVRVCCVCVCMCVCVMCVMQMCGSYDTIE